MNRDSFNATTYLCTFFKDFNWFQFNLWFIKQGLKHQLLRFSTVTETRLIFIALVNYFQALSGGNIP